MRAGRRVGREEHHARRHVTDDPRRHGDEDAYEDVLSAQGGQSQRRVGQRIIEQPLHGMNHVAAHHVLQKAGHGASADPFQQSPAHRVDQKRHDLQRHRTALRQTEQPQPREHHRQRNAQRRLYHRLRFAALIHRKDLP